MLRLWIPVLVCVGLAGCRTSTLQASGEATPAICFDTAEKSSLYLGTQTAAARTVEVQAAFDFDFEGSRRTAATLRYGLTERQEVFAELTPRVRVARRGPDAVGIGDLRLGATTRFFEADGGRLSAALSTSLKLPVGDDDEALSSGEVDGGLALVVAQRRARSILSAGYELGFLGQSGHAGLALEHGLSLSLAVPWGARHAAFGTLGASALPAQDEESGWIQLGLASSLSRRTLLDLSLTVEFGEEETDLALGLSAQLAWP